jgi:hypothetical protein
MIGWPFPRGENCASVISSGSFRIPADWDDPRFPMERETRDLFERFIARRATLRIDEVDDGIPWIQISNPTCRREVGRSFPGHRR